ncbi:MAG: cytochrome P450 [Betaproteobacteria bacterium]
MDAFDLGPLATFPIPRSACPIDLPPEYAGFREEGLKKVTMWNGHTAWIVTRRDDITAILSSPHVSPNPRKPGFPFLTPSREVTVKNYQTFITMDPPDHTKFRRMLGSDFSPKRLAEMKPQIEKMIDGLIDAIVAKGSPVDLVQMLAVPLPVAVVSMLLGVPLEDSDKLMRWTNEQLDLSGTPESSQRAGKQMLDYFERFILDKVKNPEASSAMLNRLVNEQIKPGHITVKDAQHMAHILYFAGADTTANQIALGTLSFLLNRDQYRKLMDHPELLDNAIEEMLRIHSVAHFNAARVATADITIRDQTIRAGEGIYSLVCAGNRDPAVFPNPDQFDIERPNAKDHIAFSWGIHQCIGQMIVRMELRMVFQKLFARLPNIELAVPFEELRFKKLMMVHGLLSLPVKWG